MLHVSFDSLPRDCWLDIDTAQLAENVRRLQAYIGRPILAAVKGNGYGHGYEIAAKAFLAGGARYLGVANLAEGLLLRQAGITAPILIMGGMLPHDMAPAAAAGLEFVVFRPDHIAALREIPKGSQAVRVHIKVDTGMGRLGCFPEEVAALGELLRSIPGVQIAGLSTHFAASDAAVDDFTNVQIGKFESAIASLAAKNIRPEIIHAAKSSGSLYYPRSHYDMIRCGIVAYGIAPADHLPIPDGIKPALAWRARFVATKVLPANSTVSYGREYAMPKDARVGVLPVGYVDGFRRLPKNSNKVLVDGQERKTLGLINMDQCMVDLDGFPDITGAEAVLLGSQGDKRISVSDLAGRWGTNKHDVLSCISVRVPRRVASL